MQGTKSGVRINSSIGVKYHISEYGIYIYEHIYRISSTSESISLSFIASISLSSFVLHHNWYKIPWSCIIIGTSLSSFRPHPQALHVHIPSAHPVQTSQHRAVTRGYRVAWVRVLLCYCHEAEGTVQNIRNMAFPKCERVCCAGNSVVTSEAGNQLTGP